MEDSLLLYFLSIVLYFMVSVSGLPINFPLSAGELNPLWASNYFLTAIGFLLMTIIVIFGCLCCRNGKGFKEFRNNSGSLSVSRPEGFVNPISNSELTIFPPNGANTSQVCRFEPLPNIKPQAPNLRPAAFSNGEREISSQDWFSEFHNDFPRNKLKYLQEYGRGWFGRVVEGEAQNIIARENITKVMVKILHEDATPTDQMYFLHEVKFYRDLNHPNILRLLGRCLETEPFLIILECYPNGDLKTFLSQNLASARALAEQGVTLKMCCNITSGLQFMHDNKFIHTDLAARNCLVGPDLTVKIGDYGNSIEIFKSDYYCAGSVALPVRWCAPETLKCTDMTIETREVTPPANIWSLAVVFWEICEFCKLPYSELSDDQVIVRVLGEKNYLLNKPNMFCLYKDELYNLMKLCWNASLQRPTASQISDILINLASSNSLTQTEEQDNLKQMSQDFEQRWQNLKSNHIPKKDNAIEKDLSVNCNIISSKLKNAKVSDSSFIESPLGVFMSNKDSSRQESPRFCLKSDKEKFKKSSWDSGDERTGQIFSKNDVEKDEKLMFERKINEELVQKKVDNFHNSNEVHKLPEVSSDVDSWLKGVEINNEEDESFVRKISEAIRDLDATLEMEKTSSSEENSGESSHQNTPEKDMRENKEIVIDFKLGSDTSSFLNFTQKTFELSSLQNTEQPHSLNFTESFFAEKKRELNEHGDPTNLSLSMIEELKNNFNVKNDIFDDSLKENESLLYPQSRNSSDTDDEIWRKRIEKGEISEKVKEKSKSIANLMILTHIDPSDDSDIDLDKPFEKSFNRSSLSRRSGSFAKSSLPSNNFGSENDITYAVLEDDFKESLKKLSNDHKEYGRFDSLEIILPSTTSRENFYKISDSFVKSLLEEKADDKNNENTNSKTNKEKISTPFLVDEKVEQNINTYDNNNFLGNVASETFNCNKKFQDSNQGDVISKKGEDQVHKFFGDLKDNLVETSSPCNSSIHDTNSNYSSKKDSSRFKKILNEELDLSKNCLESSVHDDIFKPRGLLETEIVDKTSKVDASNLLSKIEDEETMNQSFSSRKTETELVSKSEEYDNREPSITTNYSKADEGLDLCIIPEIAVEAEEKKKEGLSEILKSESLNHKFSTETFNYENIFPSKINEEESKKDEKRFARSDSISTDDLEKDNNYKNKSSLPLSPIKYSHTVDLNCNDVQENSNKCNSNVIIGACEDFTLEYFKGLKTDSETVKLKVKEEEENEKNIQNIFEHMKNNEENLDVWDKHLERAFNQQLKNADFNDFSFKSFSLDFSEANFEPEKVDSGTNFMTSASCPIQTISEFIKSEMIHTQNLEGSIHLNGVTNLTETGSEEELDNFKLRTPDDERSSDSGFRDKGSFSESVEDACEGKYNLEDIEAELEEVYGMGSFNSNNELEKNTNQYKVLSGNTNNFEFEESKFYEDENKNEDFSDIDGEIEFWENKNNSDYYPEISEFNPTYSEGWYLHPPDETGENFNRNVNEVIVNALRNKLQECLPVQARSYVEYYDFYDPTIDDTKREISIHYASDLAVPLSPILEEQDDLMNDSIRKSLKNVFSETKNSNKIGRNMVNLLESVKFIDTDTFKQYLEYMIEKEGKGLDEIEEIEEKYHEVKDENFYSSDNVGEQKNQPSLEKQSKDDFSNDSNGETIKKECNFSCDKQTDTNLLMNNLENLSAEKIISEEKLENDTLVVDIDTNEASLLESPRPESYAIDLLEKDFSENIVDHSDDRLIYTPDLLSPEKERSLSETSRSSNGTRTGDALSDITLSSPDLVSDCFSTSAQENNETNETFKELEDSGLVNESDVLHFVNKKPMTQNCFSFNDEKNSVEAIMKDSEGLDEMFESDKNLDIKPQENNSYEMSTSFMGEDHNEEDNYCDSWEPDKLDAPTGNIKKAFETEDSFTEEWDSYNSGGEEDMSSSSGEFIWKNGDKESNVKAVAATDNESENSLSQESKNDSARELVTIINSNSLKEINNKKFEEDEEDDNESSTGSSGSLTDFIPSAWNSRATPNRSVLRSPDKKPDSQQKKNVWFKKQKYLCVYEYPREPSDSEDADMSPCNQLNSSEISGQHFAFGIDTENMPNKHFLFGISNVISYSNYNDWDVIDGREDFSLGNTNLQNSIKIEANSLEEPKPNFYKLNSFNCDLNNSESVDDENEFFISSSSRPFQGGSSSQFFPGNKETILPNDTCKREKFNFDGKEIDEIYSKDFVTPDSGLENSTNVSPLNDNLNFGQKNCLLKSENDPNSKPDFVNIIDNLRFNLTSETLKANKKNAYLEPLRDSNQSHLIGLETSTCLDSLSPTGLGELRHTIEKLKLELPHSHNADLGATLSKQNHQNSAKY